MYFDDTENFGNGMEERGLVNPTPGYFKSLSKYQQTQQGLGRWENVAC